MKKNRHTIIIITLFTLAFLFITPITAIDSYSKTTNIIPIPVSIEHGKGFFVFRPSIRVIAENEAKTEALKLIDSLVPAMGYRLKLASKARPKARFVKLVIDKQLLQLGDEGYILDVSARQILIRAKRPAGLFYGIQTLLQLLPTSIFSKTQVKNMNWKVPCLKITDYPRFQWRGLLIDPARHFIPVNDVKKFLNGMAMHKFNRLQIHLTDNIGWRIEIKKYPNLTKLASNRDRSGGNGGFYTQEEIRDLVRYARKRHITIVPEIEMPYHAGAAINAYPYIGINPARVEGMSLDKRWAALGGLSAPRPETVEFMQDVLTEIIELFPSRFIHIGGDEANLKLWENDPEMQKQMKQLGCKNAHELHSWFIKQMDTFLTGTNRRMIGWDEILQGGLAPGATVMSWRGIQGGITAANAGHDVVMAPTSHTYFDYYQGSPKNEPLAIGGLIPLEKVFQYDPIPKAITTEKTRHVLGVQGQLWGEYISTRKHLEYMAYPRAIALAEIGWSPKQLKDYENFISRLLHHLKRLEAKGINYRQLD
ncbi:MAG: beta-N-acetylhexosaminidase [Planctomycetota bacterium]|jgi:hexosaminidase